MVKTMYKYGWLSDPEVGQKQANVGNVCDHMEHHREKTDPPITKKPMSCRPADLIKKPMSCRPADLLKRVIKKPMSCRPADLLKRVIKKPMSCRPADLLKRVIKKQWAADLQTSWTGFLSGCDAICMLCKKILVAAVMVESTWWLLMARCLFGTRTSATIMMI